jgi:phosphatidylglycerophosphate synthase
VLCLVISGVLDCCDGELARLRFAESRLGHVLDVTGDTVVHGAVLAGIVSYLVRAGTTPPAAVLGWLAAGILGAFAAITWSEATETQRHQVDAWENRILEGVLSPLSTRDWHVFVVAFALVGRLDRLVAGGAIGAHVFWMAVTVLVVRVLRRVAAAR